MGIMRRIIVSVTGLVACLFIFLSGIAVAAGTVQSTQQFGNNSISEADQSIGVFIVSDIKSRRVAVRGGAIEAIEAKNADSQQSRRPLLDRERRLSQTAEQCCCCLRYVCYTMSKEQCLSKKGACGGNCNSDKK